ncbi:MAG: hypothetical protein DRP45_04535 [Candidatus Zixiibacteriota bacterium]|nr:MAG: hypothetical protein DRP45_04535 [candidate division Zixibacteria bacterium]
MRQVLLSAILSVALLWSATATTQACEISISDVSNSMEDAGVTKLYAGQTHVITMYAQSDCAPDEINYNVAMGFSMWSPDGAGWNYLEGHGTTDWFSFDWNNYFINHFHYDYGSAAWIREPGGPPETDPAPGSPGDSVACGFAGIYMYADQGWPGTYSGDWATLEFQTNVEDIGKHICFDTVVVPGFTWMWMPLGGGDDIYPDWGDQVCFEIIETPNLPPVFTNCPVVLTATYPDQIDYDFDAEDINDDPITYEILSGPGLIDPDTGEWSWQPELGDIGQLFTLIVCASDVIHPCPNSQECTVDIVVEASDSDGDGVYNGDDNCPDDFNPDQEDVDIDNVGDSCDNCIDVANVNQEDADGDEIGDSCDVCTDTDNDGYGNPGYAVNTCDDDNCPDYYNPTQADTDGDGIGDACDECTDTDGDGFGNPGFAANTCPDDNCPDIYNENQTDTDLDGKGDACDPGEVLFIGTPRCGALPLTVSFTDQSVPTTAITEWYWEFGDGDWSDEQNPSHEYTTNGAYDVMLEISDGSNFDTLVRPDYVVLQDSVSAGFMGTPTSGKVPLTVAFDPVLDGVAHNYYWEFGDGHTSYDRNPIHIYETQGRFDVKLRVLFLLDLCVQVDSLIKTEFVVAQDLESQFSATPRAGIAPLSVDFLDESDGTPTDWLWDFGDGSPTSTLQHPTHQYDEPGLYDVKLWVSDGMFEDSLLELGYILVDTVYCDLASEISPCGEPRPGFEVLYEVLWTNFGTSNAENCVLKVLPPPQLELVRMDDFCDNGMGCTGSFLELPPVADTMMFELHMIEPSAWPGGWVTIAGHVPDTVSIGSMLTCKSWITTTTDEVAYNNNNFVCEEEVVGSIDPNDKSAQPAGKGPDLTIAANQRLSYLVQFENKPEATAEAIYVRVVDTLDPDLDWGTLAMGKESHPDDCDWEFDPYTGVITWMCDSIMLPPNHNPPEGEGYFTYSISPLPDLPEGTLIENMCFIRFDYNEWLQGPKDGPVVRMISYGCCIPPSVGDLDQGGGDLGFNYDGADLSIMINGLFIDPTSGWIGVCLDEADVDFTSVRPVIDPLAIDGGDLSLMIDALFIAPTRYLRSCDGTPNW